METGDDETLAGSIFQFQFSNFHFPVSIFQFPLSIFYFPVSAFCPTFIEYTNLKISDRCLSSSARCCS